MEVGWYLRLAKTDRVEALVASNAIEQVRQNMYVYPDWDFEFREHDDHVQAVMTRKKPLFEALP